jgi:WhiB family redox-sensing transcriptional regulator
VALSWQSIDLRGDPDENRYEGDPAELVGALADLLAELTARPAWHREAACRGKGSDRWFVDRGGDIGPARALCSECSVRAECLEAGMAEENRLHGLWGGMSPNERKQLRRQGSFGDAA